MQTTVSKSVCFIQRKILLDSHSGLGYSSSAHNSNRIGSPTFEAEGNISSRGFKLKKLKEPAENYKQVKKGKWTD